MKNLTKWEEEVMKLVSEGLTNKEIANVLFISPHTVKAILENLFEKFNLHSRLLLTIEYVKKEVEL